MKHCARRSATWNTRVKQGYAWVFPKANHLSVGAGTFGRRSAEGRGEASKDELARWIVGYLDALGVPCPIEQIEFHGHPLPIWGGAEPIEAWNGRILLAGDAAGLVNPLFGDGISYACRSGALAGKTIASGRAALWTEILSRRVSPKPRRRPDYRQIFLSIPTCLLHDGRLPPQRDPHSRSSDRR